MLCTLGPDVNRCQHFDQKTKSCTAEQTQCAFRQDPATEKAERKEKWFEKYAK